MADQAFKIPEYREFPTIPALVPGAMAHSKPYVANEKIQVEMGFPGQLVDNW
jgi:hypothetical protein